MASSRPRSGSCAGSSRRSRTRRPAASSCPSCQGAGIPDAHRANLESLAAEFPDSAAPVVDGLHLLTPDPVDRLVARTWGAALEVTGADGLPKPRDGGNVLRPSTTLKFSLRLPPDVDAQAATDALHLGHPHRRGGARHHRHGGGRPGVGRPTARRQAWPPRCRRSRWSASGASRASSARAAPSRSWPTCSRGFPGTQFVATGVLGPHSNAHGPNESLHIPMAKAVTHAVAELLKEA